MATITTKQYLIQDTVSNFSLINGIHCYWIHLILKRMAMGRVVENCNIVDFKMKWSTCHIHERNTEIRNFIELDCMLLVLYTTLGSQKKL